MAGITKRDFGTPDDELQFVIGHEIGHYVERHSIERLPDGAKKERMRAWLERDVPAWFGEQASNVVAITSVLLLAACDTFPGAATPTASATLRPARWPGAAARSSGARARSPRRSSGSRSSAVSYLRMRRRPHLIRGPP